MDNAAIVKPVVIDKKEAIVSNATTLSKFHLVKSNAQKAVEHNSRIRVLTVFADCRLASRLP